MKTTKVNRFTIKFCKPIKSKDVNTKTFSPRQHQDEVLAGSDCTDGGREDGRREGRGSGSNVRNLWAAGSRLQGPLRKQLFASIATQTRFNGIKINIQRTQNLHLPNSKPTAACADVLNNLKDQRGSFALRFKVWGRIQFFLSLFVPRYLSLRFWRICLLRFIFSLLHCGCHSINMRMEMGRMLVYQTKPFPHFSAPDTLVSTGILIFCVSLIFAEVLSPAERRVSTAFTG